MKIHNIASVVAVSLLLPSGFVSANQSWYIVNDSVMGGLSTSQVYEKDDALVFSGTVSLENNGGFASVRTAINTNEQASNQISLRVKGDGQTYQLRLRTTQYLDGPAYTTSFKTTKDEWQLVNFTPSDFSLTFRGRILEQNPNFYFKDIRQLGIMIAKKQQGDFKLEINQIAFNNS
ncbi:CIA30 family protein [Pseudoalteromonas sp. NEC-BIFX-2020_002]|uniref:CIA30 family protein n=1 Tax=Pseudoalteromonas sp. NEC-BIFX-2020_002 TaxID=2732353 RepID=UPI0014772385|nr:CIA30 family protein [Pseudoalteromonas sp. NEC-BIFX-2020_002]NNG42426.1 CIA30 family protein [Pseudoalteromonas sp. NEC-BIFX-2020_002]